MFWATLALIGRILMLGYERIAVKQLGENSDSLAATFIFFSLATILLSPVLFFTEMPTDPGFLRPIIPASIIYSLAFILYVKSLGMGEASLVGPLYNFNAFFLLILTGLFLGEEISIYKITGIILLFYGTSYLNRQKNPLRSVYSLFKDKASRLMILCSILMAFGRTIDGYAVQSLSPLSYSFFLYLGISLILGLYLVATGKLLTAKELLISRPLPSILSASINAYAYLLLVIAFTQIDVSIAEPASMLSMIITVILAHFILGEKIRDRIIAVLIMIAGTWLLTR